MEELKKLLFIDRDGTLIDEPTDTFQIDAFEKLRFKPGVFRWLRKIANNPEFELVMVTNQDGLGSNEYPESVFWPIQNLIMKTFEGEGIRFKAVHIDKHFPSEMSDTRKPGIGMLKGYLNGEYNLAGSFVIGDRWTDVELAANLGCKAILFHSSSDPGIRELSMSQERLNEAVVKTVENWKEVWQILAYPNRTAHVNRETSETKIDITLSLDGSGKSNIDTGLRFFDHMLEQLAKHGALDIELKTRGDLEVDEHHTIEDTALALGEAFKKALGDKKGISRYGYCLPMDDALALVAIDFGGRNWLKWEVDFKREKIGDMPTEMFHHFFKSFTDTAACTLHIQAKGENEHHKIESVFKAFARAIRTAVGRDSANPEMPSTKGIF